MDAPEKTHDRPKRRSALLVALVFLLAFGNQALAQYRFTQWTAESGLPQNSVRGLVQTPDGYLWVATLNGVARFDGIRFTVFDKSNSPGITSNRFSAMVRGMGNDLWLLTEAGNVLRLHNGNFIAQAALDGLRPYSVTGITGDGTGNVWMGDGSRVYRWNPATERFERESFSTANLHFDALWWMGTGFWALDGNQIRLFERGHLSVVQVPKDVPPSTIRNVASGADGAVWLRTADFRLGRLFQGSFKLQATPFFTPMRGVPEANWDVEITTDRFQRKLHFPAEGADRPILYNAIMHDNEGNLWVGSEGEGLFCIQRQSILVLSEREGLASNNVYPILRSRNGDMWVGSWPGGLSQIRNGRVIKIFGEEAGISGLITSLEEDKDGVLWIGSHGGIRTLVRGKISKPNLTFGDAAAVAQVIYQSRDGTTLFGTPHGLYSAKGVDWRHITATQKLSDDDVRTIITSRSGDLWIGGYGGLTRVHNGQSTHWTEADGLPSNNIRCIMEDSSGDVWVGTYDGGIGWLRRGRWVVFNKGNGLFDNGAFQILEDRNKHFWISSNRGLYRLSKDQLASVADGRERLVSSIGFGQADGMLSVECNGGLWPAGAIDDRGSLWFPTQRGVAIVDPSKVRTVQQPPKVAIEAISVDHASQAALDGVTLRPGQTNLTIDYTALSYSKPGQLTFSYKLDGVDDDWQSVGLRRTAYYNHLPPGEHEFRVAAQNSDGVHSESDAVLRVTVIPPFYRRTWFLASSVVLLTSIVAASWSSRERHLQQEQLRQQQFSRDLIASQELERRRIAAEPHDSLGQRLIVINNLARFLLRPKAKTRTEEDKAQTLAEISEEATAAMEETRAISYALRPFQLDRLGLTRAIQALCTTVSKASGIEIEAKLDNIDDAFPEDLRINVYRIVQEALNNTSKHSGGSRGFVTVSRTIDFVTLTIEDDGRGLPTEQRSSSTANSGFGMTGMRERATLLNGSLTIKSGTAFGTTLTVQLPISSEPIV